MTRQDLLFLQSKQEFPSVSLIVSFEKKMPERKENVVKVNNALKEAKKQLEEKCSESEAVLVMAHLEYAARSIDYEHTSAAAVAIFANKDLSSVYSLPISVADRVVVGSSFEVRDVLHALQSVPRYWVLALSEKPSRMFYGISNSLTEIIEPAQNAQGIDVDGFPYTYVTLRSIDLDERKGGGNVTRDAQYFDNCKEKFFERVFKLAHRFLSVEPLPLFVVTTEKDHSLFETAANGYPIAGWVHGDYCKRTAHDIAEVVWPAVEEYLAAERQKKLIYFEEVARGTDHKHAEGFEAVKNAANEGRVHELLIEAELSHSGLGDAVNQLIETVLSKGKAHVIFYPKDALKKYGGVVAVLRY